MVLPRRTGPIYIEMRIELKIENAKTSKSISVEIIAKV